VVEFHGSFRRLQCIGCGQIHDASRRDELGMPPRCACGQLVKPDVVLFGETIPDDVIAGAMQLVRTCGVMLVAGTSAAVPPAANIPHLASAVGALVVEFNLEPTGLTDWCEVTILGDASETLPMLAERVEQLVG
jgi:NAD-dependent deacetylase